MTHIVTLDNRVRLPAGLVSTLPDDALEAVKSTCTHNNPDHGLWLRFRKGFRPPETVSTWKKERGGGLTFPRGRWLEVKDVLDGAMVDWEWDDQRCDGRLTGDDLFAWHGPDLRPYQHKLVGATFKRDVGIWRSRPGSGKTCSTIYLANLLQRKTLVVVPTLPIFEQWQTDVKRYLKIDPGVLGGGKSRLDRPFVISSQQTVIRRLDEVREAGFGLIACDEVQLFAKNSFGKVADAFPARYRLGVSGDEHRADRKEFAIYDWFGPEVEEVSAEEIAPYQNEPEIRIVFTKFEAPWWRTLTPEQRYESRGRLIDEISVDPDRNSLVRDLAKRCLDEGEQVLVMAERVDHCRRIEAACVPFARTALLVAEDKRQFAASKAIFAAGEAKVAVGTYKAIGVGFESHRALSRGILASPVARRSESKMQVRQFASRVARDASGPKIVYYVHDSLVYGDEPVRLLSRWFTKVEVMTGHDLMPAKSWLKEQNRAEAIGDGREGEAGELFR